MFQKRKIGKTIDQLEKGDTYETEVELTDKDILLYLGLSDDANPIYIQHDYASRTPYGKPVVPHIMLTGIISSAISMELPGPGSYIQDQQLTYPKPLYHYGLLKVHLEVMDVDTDNHLVIIGVNGYDRDDEEVVRGSFKVNPAYPWKPVTQDKDNFENF
ncbi:MaoC/PaaZ C-terminal domain-containing protein [Salisediminibacterium selenitireducens]|uniref:MaoC domain protein dehydratase n=1 Tax=Bacillus selenitireducens (strain ATCC 700615 / DSM 15326 / MLS10) TaxID=439292 RepID=D6XST2_BACIE|nr:MaoC/PaaZ C-terminal domain-containing protein [Salisediminibacterium selenitireducens]ADH98868.1 MaoC domain protein dehydratase [[Bacillus] selenitireducens MLS10]